MFVYVTLTFDPDLKINSCPPLVKRNMCTKFDGPSLNGSVCIVFTRFNNNVLW